MRDPITRRTALKTLSCGAAALGINSSLALLACKDGNEIEPSEREAIRSIAEDFRRQFDAPGFPSPSRAKVTRYISRPLE